MAGLWRDEEGRPAAKYLVVRRDGTTVEWPYFVLSARDPASPAALKAYADEAEAAGLSEEYCEDIRRLADRFNAYRLQHGAGDPDAPPHRADNPDITAQLATIPVPNAPLLSQKRLHPQRVPRPLTEDSPIEIESGKVVGICEQCVKLGNKAADGSVARLFLTSLPQNPVLCNGLTKNALGARAYANHKVSQSIGENK